MNNEIRRPDLYAIIKDAVNDGLQKIQEVKDTGKYIGSPDKSGLPWAGGRNPFGIARMNSRFPLLYDLLSNLCRPCDNVSSWRIKMAEAVKAKAEKHFGRASLWTSLCCICNMKLS